METNPRTFGPIGAKVVLTLREQGRSVVRVRDIRALVDSDDSARAVIKRLLRAGWLARATGGVYLLLPPEHGPDNLGENNPMALATAAVDPSYVGWWSAAAFHGFTTQNPLTVLVAARRQARAREVEGTPVRYVAISAKKFSDYQTYPIYGREVPVSTPTKTLIDCVDRPELAGGPGEVARIVNQGLSRVDEARLEAIALGFGSKALLQRLGFLTDLLGKPLSPPVRAAFRERIPKSARSRFGRGEPREGDIGYNSAWGLYVDARREDLLAEVPDVKG
jgi:predicted transcriptional regulator of viral defense system